MTHRERSQLNAALDEQLAAIDHERVDPLLDSSCKCRIYLAIGAGGEDLQCRPKVFVAARAKSISASKAGTAGLTSTPKRSARGTNSPRSSKRFAPSAFEFRARRDFLFGSGDG
jgi:hypothetical protein